VSLKTCPDLTERGKLDIKISLEENGGEGPNTRMFAQ